MKQSQTVQQVFSGPYVVELMEVASRDGVSFAAALHVCDDYGRPIETPLTCGVADLPDLLAVLTCAHSSIEQLLDGGSPVPAKDKNLLAA